MTLAKPRFLRLVVGLVHLRKEEKCVLTMALEMNTLQRIEKITIEVSNLKLVDNRITEDMITSSQMMDMVSILLGLLKINQVGTLQTKNQIALPFHREFKTGYFNLCQHILCWI